VGTELSDTKLRFDLGPVVHAADAVLQVSIRRYVRTYLDLQSLGSRQRQTLALHNCDRFNHCVRWFLECQAVAMEVEFAFDRLIDLIKLGVTDTAEQSMWHTSVDLDFRFYINDIAYRTMSLWDKTAQILCVYYKGKKSDRAGFSQLLAGIRRTKATRPFLSARVDRLLREVEDSDDFKLLRSYRNDLVHNITQGMVNVRAFTVRVWHTHELLKIMSNAYQQFAKTFEILCADLFETTGINLDKINYLLSREYA
jgi:hypothetical protein